MTSFTSLNARLRQELLEIESMLVEFLQSSRIEARHRDPNPFSIINATYSGTPVEKRVACRWIELTSQGEALQARLLNRYEEWFRSFRSVFRDSGSTRLLNIDGTHQQITSWIKYRRSGKMPESVPVAIQGCRATVKPFLDLLEKKEPQQQTTIVVPDTNILIDNPEFSVYESAVGQTQYTVMILPAVVAELDELKVARRDQEFINKVRRAIRRLNELSKLGDPLQGIHVGSIELRMVAVEPQFNDAPSWLNPANRDDQIITAALDIARQHPFAAIVILSNDLNMKNKASLAGLPCVEFGVSSP